MFLIINENRQETKWGGEGGVIHCNAARGEELGRLCYQAGSSD